MPKQKGSGLYFFCHKCNEGLPFGMLLKRIDSLLYEEYRRERLGSRYTKKKETISPVFNKTKSKLEEIKNNISINDDLLSMADMPIRWSEYLVQRKIPLELLWKYFFFADDFKKVANQVCPGTFSDKALKYKESRIVIKLLDANGNLTGIQGREIQKSNAKYITIKSPESKHKIFGLDRIKHNRSVYVFEGPIDSCFVENSIGVCGADLVSQVSTLFIDPIFCFDNEPYSPIISKKVSLAIDQGHKVIIYNRNNKQKDINDMVLSGIKVEEMIKQRTFSGLRARAEFNQWKRT